MKITFIITSLGKLGGTERVATILANELSHNHEVCILSRQQGENAYPLATAVKDIKFAGSTRHFIRQIKQYTQEQSPDIVVIHTMSKLTPILLFSGLRAKHLWSLEHIAFEFHALPYRLIRKILYRKLDKVITLTNSDKRNYEPFLPDIEVMMNPCPLPILTEPPIPNSKIIVSIGRLTEQKGYDLLIEAWKMLEGKYPDWQLHIYGEGEDKETLLQQISRLKLNKVSLQGTTNDVQSVYQEADLYVMSSRYEGFGLVLVEAQSQGLPIVAFDCPSGPAEIITDGEDGFLVSNGDVDLLAEKIGCLIENPALRATFSQQALQAAKRFSTDHIIKQWQALIAKETEK